MEPVRGSDFFVSGGTLPLGSASYIERSCDRALFEALEQGKYCYVLNTRQMGKSSLSVKVLARLEVEGWRTVSIDLTQMGGRNVTPDQWYAGLLAEVGRVLGLRSQVLEFYRSNLDLGPMLRFFGALREIVLASIPDRIVICVDEIDATRNLPFDTDEFFAGIRECFNRRVSDPQFNRITFCLLGVASPSDLAKNQLTTPFNIGERIYLADFSQEEMRKLEKPMAKNGAIVLQRIHYWTSGHPYLTQSLCASIVADPKLQSIVQVDRMVAEMFFGPKARERNVNLADVANRALNSGSTEADPNAFRADLLTTYLRVLRNKNVPDDDANRVTSQLKLSGLVHGKAGRLNVRNRIYSTVFNQDWVQENMPAQEVIREKQSFRRGLLRATLVYVAVLAVISVLGLFAFNSQRTAQAAKIALDRELYVADMNGLRAYAEDGDYARAAEVLAKNQSSPYRGFEWGYWQSQLHDSSEEYTLAYSAPGKQERGVLSLDGKQICVIDGLLDVATVLDRRTHRVAQSISLKKGDEIIAYESGFARINPESPTTSVRDLATGASLCAMRPENGLSLTLYSKSQSSLLISMRRVEGKSGASIEVWNPANRNRVFQMNLPKGSALFEALTSFDKRFLVIVTDAPTSTIRTAATYELSSGKKVDSFKVAKAGRVLDVSFDGSQILYSDGRSFLLARDTGLHLDTFTRPWLDQYSLSKASFVAKDRAVAMLNGAGRLLVEQFPSGNTVGSFDNVWNYTSSELGSEICLGATSVRVADVFKSAERKTLGKGMRIGRDGRGSLVVFEPDQNVLQFYNDPDLTRGKRPNQHVGLHRYTYNGRWQVWVNQSPREAWFSDTEGSSSPLKLPFVPTNYSCGLNSSVIALYSESKHQIAGVSGTDGRIIWNYTLPDTKSSGLWVSPDSAVVMAFSSPLSIVVLEARSGKLRRILQPHNLRVSNISFTSDGKGFFTFGADGRAILWDLASLKEMAEYRAIAGQRISAGDLSPDGQRVVTTTEGGTWMLWDAKLGTQITTVRSSTGPIRGALFTKDGLKIVTVGVDDRVHVFRSIDKDPSIQIPVSQSALKGIRQ